MRAIVTFHSIDDSGSVLSFPAAALDRLLASLRRAAVPLVRLDALLADPGAPGVALTFDDGMRSVLTAGLPVLRAYAAPAHLFLTTGSVGRTNRWAGQPASAPCFDMLDWAEVERLHRDGVSIEAHTVHHPDLRTLDDGAIAAESERGSETIAARLGRAPGYFSYPYGHHDARVRGLLAPHYRACVTTELRPLRGAEEAARLPRLDSYYLRAAWLLDRPASAASLLYLRLRDVVRRARGRA